MYASFFQIINTMKESIFKVSSSRCSICLFVFVFYFFSIALLFCSLIYSQVQTRFNKESKFGFNKEWGVKGEF